MTHSKKKTTSPLSYRSDDSVGSKHGLSDPGPISGEVVSRTGAQQRRKVHSYPPAEDVGNRPHSRPPGPLRMPTLPSAAFLADAPLPTHEYEPLTGGTGREVYYRQARYSASDLLGKHTDIDHHVVCDAFSGEIVDFGINGLAFTVKDGAPERDAIVEGFQVIIGSDTLYEGRALIRYCRSDANSTATVGVVLLDAILDMDAVVMAKNRALAAKTAKSLSATLNAGVSPQYKEVMADLVLLLSSYRELLESQERSITLLGARTAQELAETEVLQVAISDFSILYEKYRQRCNELTCGLTGTAKQAYRRYTEAVLHPYILSAPLGYHAYCKPLGYPGDYMLMSYLYDPQPYGDTLYDKLVHEVVCRRESMGQGVIKRKDYLLEQIRSFVSGEKVSAHHPCRILSLACGPAQEVLEFAATEHESCPPVEFTLIDQDQRSLTHANSFLSRYLIPGSTQISARYLYMGFKQMIGESDAFDSLPEQNLIYAAGLFDYVKLPTARRLAFRLFKKLAKGGTLLIGNFKRPNDSTWCLEYWMDWHLIYRDEADMYAIASKIDEPSRVELKSDSSGYTYVLSITRR